MSQVAQFFRKGPAWQRLYDWDFGKVGVGFDEFTVNGGTETGIASATYTIVGNVDNNLTITGSPGISGTKVQLLVSGGTPQAEYIVTVSIVTSPNSYQLDWKGKFIIDPNL